MSLLLPSNFVILYIEQANYVTKVWKSSLTNWLGSDDISENGWLLDGSTYWANDNNENYDDDEDKWEYWHRLLSIRLQMIERSPESSTY